MILSSLFTTRLPKLHPWKLGRAVGLHSNDFHPLPSSAKPLPADTDLLYSSLIQNRLIHPSNVKLAPTLCAACDRFWVSMLRPRPSVALVLSLTLYARAAIPRSLILAWTEKDERSNRQSLALVYDVPLRSLRGLEHIWSQPRDQRCFRHSCPTLPWRPSAPVSSRCGNSWPRIRTGCWSP